MNAAGEKYPLTERLEFGYKQCLSGFLPEMVVNLSKSIAALDPASVACGVPSAAHVVTALQRVLFGAAR